jgi:hypothetical protein
MRVTRFEGEKSLQELVRRLYAVDDPKVATAGIAAALADANPSLPLRGTGALSKAIEPGTLIAVPEFEGAGLTDASQPVDDSIGEAILERTKAAIELVLPALEADRDASVAEIKATLDLIGSKSFTAAAKRDDKLAAALKTVNESASTRLEDLAAAEQDQRLAVEGAQSAIVDLLGLANRRAGTR